MKKIDGYLSVNLDTFYKARYGHEHGYQAYADRGQPCDAPRNPEYHPGDVVILTNDIHGKIGMGVVLGWIDESDGTMKTDMWGNIDMNDVRHAVEADKHYILPSEPIKKHLLHKKFNVMWGERYVSSQYI